MALLKVQPDKVYLVAHEVIRLSPLDASVAPEMVPVLSALELKKSIDILQKHRGWSVLETVPRRKAFANGRVCCDQLIQPPGSVIKLRFRPSDFQGDTDDAHNFGTMSDSGLVEMRGLIDWVAILHFWEPAVFVNEAEKREAVASMKDGFLPWSAIPAEAWPHLRKRFAETQS